MKIGNWLLISVSALLYGIAFLWSTAFWWIVFFLPIPLLFVASVDVFSFKQGFFWGFLTFLLHGMTGILVMARMAHGQWFLGAFIGCAVLICQALCAGALFWFGHVLCTAINASLRQRLFIFVCLLAVFFIWVDWYFWCIVSSCEGYPLMHPLIIFVESPGLLYFLPVVGKQGLTILFLCFSVSVVNVRLSKQIGAIKWVIVAIIPWVLSIFFYKITYAPKEPMWASTVAVLPRMTSCKSEYPIHMMKAIGRDLRHLIEHNTYIEVVIMPESAFDSTVLSCSSGLLALWGQHYVGKSIQVIFGASRIVNDRYYNSAHWVYDGVLQGVFDKHYTMILSERLPKWCDCDMIRSLYRQDGCCEVSTGLNNRPALSINGVGECTPYICSELFCNELPDDDYGNKMILALVNDTVFCDSTKQLLWSLARFKAIMWQRDIIYVSYSRAGFLGKNGMTTELSFFHI